MRPLPGSQLALSLPILRPRYLLLSYPTHIHAKHQCPPKQQGEAVRIKTSRVQLEHWVSARNGVVVDFPRETPSLETIPGK
jgi:hypothetical protein